MDMACGTQLREQTCTKDFCGKTEGKRRHEGPKPTYMDNIKTDIKEI
jgi:hypothetical protein